MNRRLAFLVVALTVPALGVAPALAGKPKPKPKPITKTFAMQLAPVPDPPQGSPSCARAELEDISIHSETVAAKGAGTLTTKVSGFTGDWDITVYDAADGSVLDIGSGTTTPNASPGEDTTVTKVKKATTFTVRYCNFLGTPEATGTYTFTYR